LSDAANIALQFGLTGMQAGTSYERYKMRDLTLLAGQPQPLSNDADQCESDHVSVARLLEDIAAQIDNIHRLFSGKSENASALTATSPKDVVFIDDLAHCMQCSWAKLDAAASAQLAPDVVAQCSRLLEASLQVLQQIQDMRMPDSPPSTD
jgi:hypothetical protein